MSYRSRDDFVRSLAGGQTPNSDTPLRKQFVCDEVKAEGDPAGRSRTFVISTGTIDRENDVVEVAGWRLDNFLRNPVVLWAHDYRSLPIGKATAVRIDGDRLLATAEFAMHPMADQVLQLIDGGFLRATSVGFRPIKFAFNQERNGVDFQEQELLEFSVVPVPANAEALIQARAAGLDLTELKTWALTTLSALLDDHTVLQTAGAPEADAGSLLAPPAEAVTAPEPVQSRSAEVSAGPSPEAEPVKQGRVLSRANENKLAKARDLVTEVLAQVQEDAEADADKAVAEPHVPAPVTTEPVVPEPVAPAQLALALDDQTVEWAEDEGLTLDVVTEDATLDQHAESFDVDVVQFRQALSAALGEALGRIVRDQVTATLNRRRGRVD